MILYDRDTSLYTYPNLDELQPKSEPYGKLWNLGNYDVLIWFILDFKKMCHSDE